MRTTPIRRGLLAGVVIAVVALGAMPVLSAIRSGSLSITNVGFGGVVNRDNQEAAIINWQWKTGDNVKSTSQVAVQYTTEGIGWRYVQKYAPIMDGAVVWDTSELQDGAYTIRAVVWSSKGVESFYAPVVIDTTDPEVKIVEPNTSGLTIDGTSPQPFPIVVGNGRFSAAATDAGTGVDASSITWSLGENTIGTGDSIEYDFSNGEQPGLHEVAVTARDRAGNQATASVQIFWLPGAGVPSLPDGEVPEPPDGVEPPVDPNEPPDGIELPIDPNDPQLPPELQELLDQLPNPGDQEPPSPPEDLPTLEDLLGTEPPV